MKTHLYTSEYPLESNLAFIAECGAVIEHPEILAAWDDQQMKQAPDVTILLCGKCMDALVGNRERRYIYAVREKPKEKHAESCEDRPESA